MMTPGQPITARRAARLAGPGPIGGWGDPAIPHRTGTDAGTLRIYSSWPMGEIGGPPGADATLAIAYALELAGGAAGGYALDHIALDNAHEAYPDVWDATTEVANANEALADPDAVAFFGGSMAGALAQSLPLINRAERPLVVLTASATWPGLSHRVPGVTPPHEPAQYAPYGETLFVRLAPTDDRQGAVLARVAHEDGRRRAAVFHDNGPYGRCVATAFATAFTAAGGTVTRTEPLPADPVPFSGQLAAVAADTADCVVVAGIGSLALGAFVGRLQAAGSRVAGAVYASDGLPGDALLDGIASVPGGTVDGLTIVGPPPVADLPDVDGWRLGMATRAGEVRDLDPFAPHAFDATVALIQAIDLVSGADPRAIRSALLTTNGVPGVSGTVAFDADGDRIASPFRVARFSAGVPVTTALIAR